MVKKKITKGDMICFECSKFIDPKEHYVQLSTYNRWSGMEEKNLPDDHNYFHFQCFVDNFNKNVERKAKEYGKHDEALKHNLTNMKMAMEMMNSPFFQNLIDGFLRENAEKVVPKEKVLEKLQKNVFKTHGKPRSKKRSNKK